MTKEITYATARPANPLDKQKRDCSIIAVSVGLNREYEEVAERFRQHGKHDNCGAYTRTIISVINSFGYKAVARTVGEKVEKINCTYRKSLQTFTPSMVERYNKVDWTTTHPQLWLTRGHALCFKNGVVEDWSQQRDLEVKWIYDLVPAS